MQAKAQTHQLAIWVKYRGCHENLIKHLLGLVIVHGIQVSMLPGCLGREAEGLCSRCRVWRYSGPCLGYPKDGGGSTLHTSMTSDSLLCLGYEFLSCLRLMWAIDRQQWQHQGTC